MCVCSTCAGVVVALLGRELKSGLFKVEDYTFAGLARQEPLTTSMETDKEEEKYVYISYLLL